MTIVEAMSGQTGAHGMEYGQPVPPYLDAEGTKVWEAGEIGLVMAESGVCTGMRKRMSELI